MTTQAPDLAEASARDLPLEQHPAPKRRARGIVSWVLLAVAVVLLWPAQWGGLIGLTIVNGQSMESTYYTGDLVVTVRQPGYEVGDVISFRIPEGEAGEGRYVIHRIVSIDESSGEPVFKTRGDNNPADDRWAITEGDVLGAAVFHVPGLGHFMGGWLILIVVATALGGIVAVLLWPSEDDDDPADQQDAAP